MRMAHDIAAERGKKVKIPKKITDKTKYKLVGLSVADIHDSWYLPCALLGEEVVKRFANALLSIEGLTVWAHNWKAEWNSLKIDLDKVKARMGDTMLAAWATEYGEPYYANGKLKYHYGLKEVVKHVFGVDMLQYRDVVGGEVLVSGMSNEDNDALYAKEIEACHAAFAPKPPTKKAINEVRKAYNKRKREQVWRDKVASDVPPVDMKDYACSDAEWTLKLARIVVKRLKEFEYINKFWEVEMPIARIVHEMEHTGLVIDVEYFKQQKGMLHEKLRMLEKRWWAKTQSDIRKDREIADIVYNKLKCWPIGEACKTDKGNLSVNKKAIAYILQMCPEGSLGRELALIKQEHSKLYKLANTYMNVFIYQGTYNGGSRLTCDILQHGTNTGRFSMKNPNIQSTPKEMIREGLRAPEGCVLVDGDWAGLEIVVMGHYSEDAKIAEIVLTGKSQHDITAEAIGIPRDKAKAYNFALNYGGGPVTVAKAMFVPLEKYKRRDGTEGLSAPAHIREGVKRYHEAYSGVADYRERVAVECREYGYVETFLGRRRYLPDIGHKDNGKRFQAERQAANTPIQGTAADIAKMAMVQLWRAWGTSTARMVLQVHDELLVLCPAEDAQRVKKDMEELMAKPGIELILPLRAEVGIGKSWAEAKK